MAIGLYLAGLAAFGAYFVRVMATSSAPIDAYAGMRAYVVSHLGKYVPGKAVVVVMRVGMVTPHGASAASATMATLYETLVMMAAGGLVATGGLWGAAKISVGSGRLSLPPIAPAWVGLAMAAGFLAIVQPGAFPRLARLARRAFREEAEAPLPRFSGRLLMEGLILAGAGWSLLGLSQIAVIRSITPGGLPFPHWPAAVGAVALATVAGFAVAVAPGGLGVREWVLWTSLAGVIDARLAVVASLLLRLAWMAGEVAAALVLLPIRPGPAVAAGER